MIILLMVFLWVSFERNNEVLRARSLVEGERIGQLLAAHINTAVSVGDGYSANFTIPSHLDGETYAVTGFPDEQRVVVIWGTENFSYSAPVSTTNFNLNIAGYSVQVRNEGGVVYLE
ncbi:hypothetical protein KJ765_01000 [Candidatus Micrarchaeota archaeon]|nr:hypothetical protein [Candidatus Micrarchaeota archaeon]